MSEEVKKESKWERNELGALWRRKGKNQKYLSGFIKLGDELEEVRVDLMVFSNKHKKEGSNAPDFVIYKSDPPQKQNSGKQESTPKNEADGTEELMND